MDPWLFLVPPGCLILQQVQLLIMSQTGIGPHNSPSIYLKSAAFECTHPGYGILKKA
jgi:hypothetical protein